MSLTTVTEVFVRGLPGAVWALVLARAVNRLGAFTLAFLTVLLTRRLGASVTEAGLLTDGVRACDDPVPAGGRTTRGPAGSPDDHRHRLARLYPRPAGTRGRRLTRAGLRRRGAARAGVRGVRGAEPGDGGGPGRTRGPAGGVRAAGGGDGDGRPGRGAARGRTERDRPAAAVRPGCCDLPGGRGDRPARAARRPRHDSR